MQPSWGSASPSGGLLGEDTQDPFQSCPPSPPPPTPSSSHMCLATSWVTSLWFHRQPHLLLSPLPAAALSGWPLPFLQRALPGDCPRPRPSHEHRCGGTPSARRSRLLPVRQPLPLAGWVRFLCPASFSPEPCSAASCTPRRAGAVLG